MFVQLTCSNTKQAFSLEIRDEVYGSDHFDDKKNSDPGIFSSL